MPSSLTQVLVVAHTHWDREWYHSAERFRQRLVALIDEILDAPPEHGASFLLDGQAVVLDDYLTVRPERAAELTALLRDERLEAGPWYVLADELIPGGEALVRNLLAGGATVRRLGGEPPPVLYCPDSFGHPAILPELAEGFGCSLVVLWRGYGGARWPAGDTVRWRGPSGAEALMYHLTKDGYEFGSSLPTGATDAATRWARIRDAFAPRASTGVALLLNGADHHARQREQARAFQLLADAGHPVRIQPSSLRGAAEAMSSAASKVQVATVTGELRDSYGYAWTLGGTLGTRAAQKRRNALAERALVRDVEPWIALTMGGGEATARALVQRAWRDLLLGHPHDTLCGTSIDTVATALDARLESVREQAVALRDDALQTLLQHDVERARLSPDAWRPALLVRNSVARERSGVAEVTVARKVADVAVGPGSGARQGAPVEPEDVLLAAAGLQVVSRRRTVSLTESPRAYPDADLVDEVTAVCWVDRAGGYTVQSRELAELRTALPSTVVRVEDAMLDNGLLRVTVDERGRVRLEDLTTGESVPDLIGFEHERDVGDLYTPAIRESLGTLPFSGCTATLDGPLRGELTLRYTDGEGRSTIALRLQLDAGLAALRLALDGCNAMEDVRLRMRCATGRVIGATTLADAAFHPVERSRIDLTAEEAATEHVVPTAPLHRFVTRFGARAGVTLVSDGLAEYEAADDGALYVTLLRAVSQLSRADLPERPGHAGWPSPTPLAQSQGPWSARFAVALHGGDSAVQRDSIERLADDVLLPLTGETLRSNLAAGRTAGGLELEGAGLAFSAAKPAERAGWIVLRCVNRRAETVRGRWCVARSIDGAFLARLDETPGEPLPVTEAGIEFDAPPMAIVTVVAKVR